MAVRRGGANFHAMGAKETSDLPMKETPIKITTKPLGKTAGIHEEPPENVDEAIPRQIRESIHPGVPGGQVHEKEAILVPPRANALTVSNVCANSMAGARRFRHRPTSGTTVNVDSVSDRKGRLTISGHVEPVAKVFEGTVIKFPATK
jgi:hypothetical protein